MKLPNLNKEAREICEQAYGNKENHFHNESFVEDYINFCKATDYKDTDAENFMVYTSVYGGQSLQREQKLKSISNSGGRMLKYGKLIEIEGLERTFFDFIEHHRIQMMKRMRNANKPCIV